MNLCLGNWIAVTRLARICAAAVLVSLPACSGLVTQTEQSAQPAQAPPKAKPVQHNTNTKKTPKPEPTQQELFDYVRGNLLSLSPSDGINDNLEVAFDPATSILSITQPDGRCDILLNAIDTNSPIWDVFDPSETYHTREEVLRLTLTSVSGKNARTCYDKHNQVDTNVAANRARLLFSYSKASAVPNFSENMGKAIKKLIVLSGGAAEKKLF
jgi:hypothetical protein